MASRQMNKTPKLLSSSYMVMKLMLMWKAIEKTYSTKIERRLIFVWTKTASNQTIAHKLLIYGLISLLQKISTRFQTNINCFALCIYILIGKQSWGTTSRSLEWNLPSASSTIQPGANKSWKEMQAEDEEKSEGKLFSFQLNNKKVNRLNSPWSLLAVLQIIQ